VHGTYGWAFTTRANVKDTTKSEGDVWEHNQESFKELWKSVGDEMGTKWDVKAWFWRFGLHSGLGREDWFRQEEHGLLLLLLRGCRCKVLHISNLYGLSYSNLTCLLLNFQDPNSK
jgi:hypothetical protein